MPTKKIVISIIIVILVALGIFFVASSGSGPAAPGEGGDTASSGTSAPSARDQLPDLELMTASGETISLASFVGTPMVVNSWATWCPFCVDELPDFVELKREFGDAIVVVAVNRRESIDRGESFLSSVEISPEELVFLYDADDNFYRLIGGFSMPETLFVDAEGGIVVHKRGFMLIDEMRENVEKIIDG